MSCKNCAKLQRELAALRRTIARRKPDFIKEARLDPRQESLLGPEHKEEILSKKVDKLDCL